ncbi:MAG: hypothetical protein GW947_04320, partial [Candidatus Pacebacteria bacterium]|nr:hypothetical protein [Candidatus Paceibacterota bacterium]
MKAEQDQSQADGLNLIEQLIMDSFTRLDGEKGLPLLLYSLLSGEINLPKPDSLQESQLEELENAEAARKILAKLPQELLLKKETIELIDSVFSEIETALVKARKMLQSLPENLWSEQPLEAPDFTPRQRAGEGVQNISGRQTAIEYLPKKINQIEMWSFLTVVRAMFKN